MAHLKRPPLLSSPPAGFAPAGGVRQHRARSVTAPADVRRVWPMGPVLDQGRSLDCTGFAMVAAIASAPGGDVTGRVSVGNALGHNFADTVRDGGAGGLGIADLAQARGAFESYLTAASLEEVRDAVIATGPIAVGIVVYRSMWQPNEHGRLIVRADNDPYYHAITIRGYDPAKRLGDHTAPAFLLRNSWGLSWGALAPGWRRLKPWRRKRTGEAWITVADFARVALGNATDTNPDFGAAPVGRSGARLYDLLHAQPS